MVKRFSTSEYKRLKILTSRLSKKRHTVTIRETLVLNWIKTYVLTQYFLIRNMFLLGKTVFEQLRL